MSQGRKQCSECGADMKLREKTCADCGAAYCAEFVFGPLDYRVSDKPGCEIAISPEKVGGFRLRVAGKPPTFHKTYAALFTEIRRARAFQDCAASTKRNLETLVGIEASALLFVQKLAKDMKL